MRFSIIALFGLVAHLANAIELSADTYDVETEGKTVMIKFFAPWCGHCKKMKPDWDTLMDEFKDSKTQLVADVDCTTDGGKPLCEANGVKGFPTLKWGDPASLEDYQGGRDLATLRKFATDNLKPICSPTNLDLCEASDKEEIEKYLKMGETELTKLVDEAKTEIDTAESDFKTFVEGLQDSYQEGMKKKDDKVAEIKAGGLGLMQKCLTSLKKEKGSDEL